MLNDGDDESYLVDIEADIGKCITDAEEAAKERWYTEDAALGHEVQPEEPDKNVKMKDTRNAEYNSDVQRKDKSKA